MWYYRHSLKSYSYFFRGPFLNIALSERINGFLKRSYGYCFTENVFEVKVHQLLNSAMHDLSTKMQSPDHINLYPLLPPYRDRSITLRPREHDYELPICTYNITSPPPPSRGAKYCDHRVSMSVSGPACPPACLKDHTSKLHEIFSERELAFTLAICWRPSVVCLSVCR